jgi:hypothetical protein
MDGLPRKRHKRMRQGIFQIKNPMSINELIYAIIDPETNRILGSGDCIALSVVLPDEEDVERAGRLGGCEAVVVSCRIVKLNGSDMNKEAKEIEAWMNSDEGKRMADPKTLNLHPEQKQYLENRLHRAFQAGMSAGKRIERFAKKDEGES